MIMYKMIVHFKYTDNEGIVCHDYKVVYAEKLKEAKASFNRKCLMYANVEYATVYKEGIHDNWRTWERSVRCIRDQIMIP